MKTTIPSTYNATAEQGRQCVAGVAAFVPAADGSGFVASQLQDLSRLVVAGGVMSKRVTTNYVIL
jgi:hypothetical protein